MSTPAETPAPAEGKRPARGLCDLLFLRPLKLFRRNPGIVVVVAVLVPFNLLTPGQGVLTEVFTPGWLFDGAPGLIGPLLRPPVLAGAVLLYLAKNVVSAAVAQEMMLIFRNGRARLWEAVRALRPGSVVWLTVVECCTYAVFALAALLAYLPALLAWRAWRVDLTVPLLVVGVLVYPVFYAVTSTTAMMCVLPASARERLRVLRHLTRTRVFWPLYGYYAVRIVVEVLLLGIGPLVLLDLVHSKILASAAIALGVLLPFLLLRGASYALTLELLKADVAIGSVFADHLARGGLARR
ncbi:hypothetical protein FNH05_03480 [Amycolatopsis rhizosphaerae]|uniref:Uncharacterized protein n=1 Tax=Amycolatopsis rhizosphaerae TaxID=2053003 RepID=A0A558DJF2_9PSEU|nr:hypothetical protein [Amycolatopsis rhizosphaerae]TVT61149.1 hypothetical protein FNH05_03480 [Amycolatopsis rhizosphaerae]